MKSASVCFYAAALSIALCATPSQATVTIYSSASLFNATAGAPTNTATFQSFSFGPKGQTLIDDGILFTSLPGGHPQHDVYIATPNTLTNTTINSSTVLTADGDENFRMQLNSGVTFGAIGFDFISNQFGNPIISLFGVGGVSLGSFNITTAKNANVYFGATSDIPISYVQTTVDRGFIQDTAYDNVSVRSLAVLSAVPEPATWGLMLIGFAMVGIAMRKRRTVRMSVSFA